MPSQPIDQSQVRQLLLKNWMTHDALWYREVASKLGMVEASPMNLRVCRKLGQTEFKRLMQLVAATSPGDMESYRELFEIGRQIFVPDFMSFEINYPGDNVQQFNVSECFAHRGMEKAGLLPEYECGIFERIAGWLDAMELNFTLKPNLRRCLKYQGDECRVRIRIYF